MRVWLSQSCPVGRPWPSYTDTAPSVLPPTTTRTRVSLSVRVGVSADHRWLSQSCPVGRPWPSYTDTVPSVLPPTTTRTRVSSSATPATSSPPKATPCSPASSRSTPAASQWSGTTRPPPAKVPRGLVHHRELGNASYKIAFKV